MSTIDALRNTLADHADLVDGDLSLRSAAVRRRARAVRRTRRTAVAGLTAALVLGTVVAVPRLAERTSPQWLDGLQAPSSLTSLGSTYDFARGVSGEETTGLELAASDRPRLVSWDGDSAEVFVNANGDAFPGVVGFADYVLVPEGVSGTWKVRGSGTVGLAVYELAESPGLSNGQAVFRDEVAGAILLGGGFADRGSEDLAFEMTLPAEGLSVAAWCPPDGAALTVTIDDKELLTHGCSVARPFAPGPSWSTTSAEAFGVPGEPVVVRARRTADGSVLPAGEAAYGIGIYSPAPKAADVGGVSLPQLLEHEGHLWILDEVVGGDPGETVVRTAVEARPDDPAHVLVIGSAEGAVVGVMGDARLQHSGGGYGGLGVAREPQSAVARTPGTGPTDGEQVVGLAIYRRAD